MAASQGERASMDESAAVLALQLTAGAGHVTVNRIVAVARGRGLTTGALLALTARRLHEVLPPGAADLAGPVAAARREARRAKALVERTWGRGADFVLRTDAAYPSAFAAHLGRQAPPLLALRGNAALLEGPAAAVVGTRTPSDRGIATARACAEALCGAGAVLVSGGADGVDTAAHRAAVERGGKTVVVLPQGILTYPVPTYLAPALDDGRALLLSAFPPDAPWQTHAAITRNDLIAALARLVCVVEPRKTGGSVRTGRRALEQGKPVFDLPAPGPRSAGIVGAAPLVDATGALRKEVLAEALRAAPPPSAVQPDLFA